MRYYHVRISVEGILHDEVKTDIDEEILERQFLGPYRSGTPITINGKTVPMASVTRIRISTSDESSAQLIERIRTANRQSGVVHLGGPSYAWRAAARAADVTDQFITGAPGSVTDVAASVGLDRVAEEGDTVQSAPEGLAVFVVAGRDTKAVNAVVAFLRALGLRIVEWEHAVAKTGLPNPYVGDVVEAGLRMAQAAVVVLTPDDIVRLRDDLVTDHDSAEEREFRGQARPNVYYEAGIADTLGRERTVIIEIGEVKSFSDAAGRHVVRYDGSPGKRNALAERLRLAGLTVDTSGTDWLQVGDVGPAVSAVRAALEAPTSSASMTVDRDEVTGAIDRLLDHLGELRARSRHDDLSDLPDESLEFTFRAQALFDRYASGSSYALEVERVRGQAPHLRIPVLAAAMRALLLEVQD